MTYSSSKPYVFAYISNDNMTLAISLFIASNKYYVRVTYLYLLSLWNMALS